jgi:hypothetical protein
MQEARTQYLEALCEKEDADVLATEFGNLNGPEIACLWLQHALITDWLSQTGYSGEEQQELVLTKESLSLEIHLQQKKTKRGIKECGQLGEEAWCCIKDDSSTFFVSKAQGEL